MFGFAGGVQLSLMVATIASITAAFPPIAVPLPNFPSPDPVFPVQANPLTPLDCSTVSDTSFYGHLPYPEAARSELVSVGGGITLQQDAARQFLAMQAAAAIEGVSLYPLSGFRSVATQEDLFYGVAAARGQSPAERALVSAPPGHSEHHTGYAIDIGDGDAPGYDLIPEFEETAAGRWLFANAASYGFELSFPPQHACVSYEPWHWRWVGDRRSQDLFATARAYDALAGIQR